MYDGMCMVFIQNTVNKKGFFIKTTLFHKTFPFEYLIFMKQFVAMLFIPTLCHCPLTSLGCFRYADPSNCKKGVLNVKETIAPNYALKPLPDQNNPSFSCPGPLSLGIFCPLPGLHRGCGKTKLASQTSSVFEVTIDKGFI